MISTPNGTNSATASPSAVQPFVGIRPPSSSDDAPPALSFRRKRRVDLPWDRILGDGMTSGETSIASIRDYFESSWGLGAIDESNLSTVIAGDAAYIKMLQAVGGDAKGKPVPATMYKADVGTVNAAGKPDAQPGVQAGLVVQHGISGRWYLMVPRGAQPLSLPEASDLEAYRALWQDQVDGVELVFDTADAAKSGATTFSEVDLRPAVIHRAFNELLIHKKFASDVSTGAATATKNAVDKIIGSTLDIDELHRLQNKSFQLQMQAYEAQSRIDRLVTQAADLGYYLFPEATAFTFPGGAKTDVKQGQIYTQYRRTATWVTTHHRSIAQSTGWWIFKSSKTVRQAYTQTNAKEVTDYQQVDTSRDPLVEAVAKRRAEGHAVFVFERGPYGFVTADGTPLREVMEQCDRNESFRQRCTVMLPVVEESLTGARVLTKYSVFERPLPAISPSTLPRFSLLESLSYRTAWLESQLGELVSTINLAPGEERTITLTKSFERETTVSRSSTSIFDINSSDSSDLATEMEEQARQESENSSNMSYSAKAGGGFGGFSAEASASGGNSASLKSFGQAISKVAKKASQSLNQQNREEVSTSSSAKTTVSSKDETTATIRNINQGRTLNLMFHRLNNRFRGGIYLDGLQFEVIPSTEIIAGSGVYEALRFSLEEMPQVLEQFKRSRLPFDIVPEDESKSAFLDKVTASLKSLLEDEYVGHDSQAPPAPAGPMLARRAASQPPQETPDGRSVSRLSLGPAPRQALRVAGVRRTLKDQAGAESTELSDFVARLKGATIDSSTPILSDDLLLASGGLYLDAVVGAQASTEPYSEDMRAQEIGMRKAEVQKTLAEAAYQTALAQSLGQRAPTKLPDNAIVGVVSDAAHRTLQVHLRQPLGPGDWALRVDGKRKAELGSNSGPAAAAVSGADNPLVFRWERAQPWLAEDDLEQRVTLQERASRLSLAYAG